MAISEDTWHSQLVPSVLQWSCHYIRLNNLNLSRQGVEHLTFRMQGEFSNQLHHFRGDIWGNAIPFMPLSSTSLNVKWSWKESILWTLFVFKHWETGSSLFWKIAYVACATYFLRILLWNHPWRFVTFHVFKNFHYIFHFWTYYHQELLIWVYSICFMSLIALLNRRIAV